MDCSNSDNIDDFKVDEGAFWHINMDLYYGYQAGEVVEVEHESNKYWLATIKYSFKHLVLLEWIGDYGEFWVDTSTQSSITSSSNTFDGPKRLFPPGYHLQSQLKSQFSLACPTAALVKPTLYNPAKDPYASIRTVEDLLNLEVDVHNDDYANPTSTSTGDSTSLVLAKCKTRIDFGQEDVDELEAALQNLNEIDSDDKKKVIESSDIAELEAKHNETNSTCDSTILKEETVIENIETNLEEAIKTDTVKDSPEIDNDAMLYCKDLQQQALTTRRYCTKDKKVFYLKPKQFFDIGGANHEKVLVPGTLLEVSYSEEEDTSLRIYQWLAVILKNVGGRLTLRWFLCSDPKFKQGRVELKSYHSEYVIEEEEGEDLEDSSSDKPKDNVSTSTEKCISATSITFCLHFCNPRIQSLGGASEVDRAYKIPKHIFSNIEKVNGIKYARYLEGHLLAIVFDQRRENLDKDRPIIDHLLSTVRWKTPQYINLAFAPKDEGARREVLISSPKATKLLRGCIKKELETCVYEVHSDCTYENDEMVKFIHPYDTSYSVLPLDWATNNQDCLSVHPSRTHTPSPSTQVAELVESIKNEVVMVNDNLDGVVYETKVESNSNEPINHQKLQDHTDPEESQTGNIIPQLDRSLNESVLTKEELKINDTNITIPTIALQESPLEAEKRMEWFCKTSNLQLQCEIPRGSYEFLYPYDPSKFDERDPTCWATLIRKRELLAEKFRCSIDYTIKDEILYKFKVMDQLEVVHPSSDSTICMGRIRKVVYPLLWIQISPDSYTLLPFNSTDIYPSGWCEANNHPIISLLPVRKRLNQGIQQPDKKRKRIKNSQEVDNEMESDLQKLEYEKEHFDLASLKDKQIDIDLILNQKSAFIRIYFNHKCFTGPSLSKGKICSLPQYVGPGPLRLVMEEVVTKVISVAYVPPRILNDLSSKPFEELLIARGLTNTTLMEFKAKYQKRVHREDVPVCLNLDDIALYCECVCEHLKCCYNLFGPNLYDGDDCPGHCRALTKSNKFMKRATYYREKARLGEFLNDGNGSKKSNNNVSSRARYSGRESSESNSSSASKSDQLNNRASATASADLPNNDLKENLNAVDEELDEETMSVVKDNDLIQDHSNLLNTVNTTPEAIGEEPEVDKVLVPSDNVQNSNLLSNFKDSPKQIRESEFSMLESQNFNAENWSTTDVVSHLELFHLGCFTPHMLFEHVDGQALLLLDRVAIKEHFRQHPKATYTPEEVSKLCRFVEFVKTKTEIVGIQA